MTVENTTDPAKFVPLNLDALLDLAGFVSPDPTRYYLHGVYVDHATGHYVATDGHMLGVIECKTAKAAPAGGPGDLAKSGWIITINKEFLATVRKVRREWKFLDLTRLLVPGDMQPGEIKMGYLATEKGVEDNDLAGFINLKFSIVVNLIDGSFPDWERVVPMRAGPLDRRIDVAADPQRLPAFGLGRKEGGNLYLFAADDGPRSHPGTYPDGPYFVLSSANPAFFGVIQPKRFGDQRPNAALAWAPTWLRTRLERGEATRPRFAEKAPESPEHTADRV